MNDVRRGAWATAKSNKEFWLIRTNSGYRSGTHADPKGKQYFLLPEASDEELGVALRDAMAHSRWVLSERRVNSIYHPDVEFDRDLYDYKLSIERHDEWTQVLMARYGYKTKRELFRDMKSVYVGMQDSEITMIPSHHERLEMWSGEGISESDYVALPANSSAEELGSALRQAFSRCTG